jgi:hypothetical protein
MEVLHLDNNVCVYVIVCILCSGMELFIIVCMPGDFAACSLPAFVQKTDNNNQAC